MPMLKFTMEDGQMTDGPIHRLSFAIACEPKTSFEVLYLYASILTMQQKERSHIFFVQEKKREILLIVLAQDTHLSKLLLFNKNIHRKYTCTSFKRDRDYTIMLEI